MCEPQRTRSDSVVFSVVSTAAAALTTTLPRRCMAGFAPKRLQPGLSIILVAGWEETGTAKVVSARGSDLRSSV